MKSITYSAFQNSMKSKMRELRESPDILLVTSEDSSENVIIMNASHYESLMETVRSYENMHLLGKICEGDHNRFKTKPECLRQKE